MQKSAFTARCAADRNFTPGVTLIRGGVHICTAVKAEELSLLLYRKGEEAAVKIDFPKEGKTGGLWTMDLHGASGERRRTEHCGAISPQSTGAIRRIRDRGFPSRMR